MSTPQQNVASLRAAYQFWHDTRGASVDRWLEIMADDVVVYSLGTTASGLDFSKGMKGKENVRAYFEGLTTEWEMMHYAVDDYIADGDRVVMVGRCAFRSRRTGQAVESPKADVFRFRDGLIVEVREFFDSARAQAAATGG